MLLENPNLLKTPQETQHREFASTSPRQHPAGLVGQGFKLLPSQARLKRGLSFIKTVGVTNSKIRKAREGEQSQRQCPHSGGRQGGAGEGGTGVLLEPLGTRPHRGSPPAPLPLRALPLVFLWPPGQLAPELLSFDFLLHTLICS